MTREGGAQPKEYLAKYGAERVRSVSAAWLGSTFGCAECHDHKFDPIKTQDFYALKSFFADVKQWGVYANYGYTPEPELIGVDNDSPFPPEIAVESPYLRKEFLRARDMLDDQVKAAREKASRAPSAKATLAAWEQAARGFLGVHADGWTRPAPTARLLKAGKLMDSRAAAIGDDGRVAIDKALARGDTMEVTLPPGDLTRLAALRIEAIVGVCAGLGQQPALGASVGYLLSQFGCLRDRPLPPIIRGLERVESAEHRLQRAAGLLQAAAGGNWVALDVLAGPRPAAGHLGEHRLEHGRRAAAAGDGVEPP
jgi:hypothetical protein